MYQLRNEIEESADGAITLMINNGTIEDDVVTSEALAHPGIEALTHQPTYPVRARPGNLTTWGACPHRLTVWRMKGNMLLAQVAPKNRVWATCDQFLLRKPVSLKRQPGGEKQKRCE